MKCIQIIKGILFEISFIGCHNRELAQILMQVSLGKPQPFDDLVQEVNVVRNNLLLCDRSIVFFHEALSSIYARLRPQSELPG